MIRQLAKATLLGAIVFAAFAAAQAGAAEKTKSGKIRVVIIDGQNNHQWQQTTPVMKQELEDTGRFTVDVSTSDKADSKKPADWEARMKPVPFPPDLSKYDVVLSNYNGAPWPKQLNDSLEEHLKAGKIGLVIVHAANNSFGGWPEYNKMIGMGWRGNTFGERLTLDAKGNPVRVPKGQGPGAGHGAQHPFRVVVRDSSHPITKGMPKEWMHAQDELYQGMRGPIENVTLLATAYADKSKGGTGQDEPMIWTVTYGKGRVFHTPMGHDVNGMRCVGFLTTLARGTEWAATGNVTLPIPPNFPSPDKTSSVPSK
jgi:uncharacterized protein